MPILFGPTGTGQTGAMQTYVAPATGLYQFELAGAAGSGGNVYRDPALKPKGGKGAKLTARVQLSKGDVLWIIVGQIGTCTQATATDGTSGGGGGGTFIFKLISAITDSRYQFTKTGQAFEVLLIAAGGGGSNDTSYQNSVADGLDGDASNAYSPSNYIAPNTTTGAAATSSAKADGMGIQQIISYDAAGGRYTRGNGLALGGYGGGGCADDTRCAGGGWYGASYIAYSWANALSANGISGANEGHGYVCIISPELIVDRTQADFDQWRVLSQIAWNDMAAEQKAIWSVPMKGAYNYTDLNRVGSAMLTLKALFATYGISVSVTARSNYIAGEWPTSVEMSTYIQSLKNLKSAVSISTVTPPDSMDNGTVIVWNNIEQILLDVEDALYRMAAAWFYSGDLYGGEI